MVKDMYAIYESYITKETVSVPMSITNSAGRANTLVSGQAPTADQGVHRGDLGQDNQEITIPKEILKVIERLTKSTHKADWRSQMLIDCMQLRKLLEGNKK